jgi:hypothetical protein
MIIDSTYPSEECNVETRGITVDKLESKHFGGERIIILSLGAVVLWNTRQTFVRHCINLKKSQFFCICYCLVHDMRTKILTPFCQFECQYFIYLGRKIVKYSSILCQNISSLIPTTYKHLRICTTIIRIFRSLFTSC